MVTFGTRLGPLRVTVTSTGSRAAPGAPGPVRRMLAGQLSTAADGLAATSRTVGPVSDAAGASALAKRTVQLSSGLRAPVAAQLQPGGLRIARTRTPRAKLCTSLASLPAAIAAPPASRTSSRSANGAPVSRAAGAPLPAGLSASALAALPVASDSVSAGKPTLPGRMISGTVAVRALAPLIWLAALAWTANAP